LKTRVIHLCGVFTDRALGPVNCLACLETNSLLSSIAVRWGFSLFGKFRSVVRKNRS